MEALLQDIRFALRMIVKSPWFSAVVVLVMAIGIGGTTAMFSVVDALLIRPLPYRTPERVVQIMPPLLTTVQAFRAIREGTTCFETLAGRGSWSLFTLLEGDTPERVWSNLVTPDYFQVIDGKPLLGRTFSQEEGRPGKDQVTVLSYDLWQRRFGADPAIIGRNINLNGKPFTVIGVMPKDYIDAGGFPPLFTASSDYEGLPPGRVLMVAGRLKPGVDVQAAEAEVSAILQRVATDRGENGANERVRLMPVQEMLTRDVRPVTLMLFVAVVLLLLITCANVALLLLSRATSRQMEIATRAALGATPGRIVRQLLTESAVLGLLAGTLGLLLAMWGVDLLISGLEWNQPKARMAGVDGRVLAFTLAVSLATALGFGLFPALFAARRDVHASLKAGGTRATASGRTNLLRNALVIMEIVLALTLSAGAFVLAKSFAHLAGVDPGFDRRGVSIFSVQLWSARYASPEAKHRFVEAAREKIRALPGVTSVAAGCSFPMSNMGFSGRIDTEGRPPWPKGGAPDVEFRRVSTDYLSTLRIPLREGRFFDENDSSRGARVAVVNETMAKRFWPGERSIGKRILVDEKPEAFEVVGVIGDTRNRDAQHEPIPEVVFPIAQHPREWVAFAVRASGSPAALRASVLSAMRDSDPELAFADMQYAQYHLTTLEETFAHGLSVPRFGASLLGLFAATALILTAVGVFGVTAYAVEQRTREIGIRMALGAHPRDIIRLVLKQSAVLTLIGVGIGLPVALFASSALRALVYGVSPADPAALAAAAVLLTVVTLVASYLPARRATRISPMTALQAD